MSALVETWVRAIGVKPVYYLCNSPDERLQLVHSPPPWRINPIAVARGAKLQG
jgi:hypothetical protein